MIDFVSTRAEVDPATRRAAHFLASIAAQRVRDACTPPDPRESADGRNYDQVAREAIEYLFDPGSDFAHHLDLLGGGAPSFRAALLDYRPLPPKGSFTEPMRRVLQARYRWWVEACRVLSDV